MAKLVVLTQSMAGRSIDLAGERTTVGRVEDNAFQIAEPSVSSRHCEILLRGEDIVVKDLNSTNGTFINGEKISESVLKPGQTLRLGNVELKLDVPGAPVAPAAPSSPAPAPDAAPSSSASAPSTPPAAPATSTASSPTKKAAAATGGVSVSDLGGGGRPPGFDTTSKDFTKKKPGKTMIFWIVVGVALVIILILILVVLSSAKGGVPST